MAKKEMVHGKTLQPGKLPVQNSDGCAKLGAKQGRYQNLNCRTKIMGSEGSSEGSSMRQAQEPIEQLPEL